MDKSQTHNYPAQIVVDLLRLIGYVISKLFWFVRYEGLDYIPDSSSGGFLIAANHQTYIDPVWICLPMRRRLRFMAVGKAFEWRFVGKLIRYLGAFPVTDDARGGVRAMKTAITSLQEGAALTVFPEGARALADGQMLPFKNGAVRIALEADVPVLPVSIRGGEKIWPRNQEYPNVFGRVTVRFHPPIKIIINADLTLRENLDIWTDQLRSIIGADIEHSGLNSPASEFQKR